MGPMGGRGAGFCAGSGAPGSSDPVPGRGFGIRFGPGYPHPDPEQEKQGLKNRAETLESELDAVRKRIRELETGSAEK